MRDRLALLAALCLLGAVPASGQERPPDALGRLFFSPQARAALERQRLLESRGDNTIQGETLTVDGIVWRSNGAGTTWINGVARHYEGKSGAKLQHGRNDPVQTTVHVGDGIPLSVQVGESVNRTTGEKRDNLAGGQVIVKRAAAGSRPARP
jgi:hypothetical protein